MSEQAFVAALTSEDGYDVLLALGTNWIPSAGRLFGPNDFVWVVSQLDTTTITTARQVIIDTVVRVMQFGVGVEDLDAVLSASIHHGDLAKGIDGFTRAIDIDSEAAAALRKQQERFAEMTKRHEERPRLDPPPAERVRRVLEQVDAGETAAFWRLFLELTLKPDSTHYDKAKQPFLIQRPDKKPFALAGIWDSSVSSVGEVIEACAIITRDAEGSVAELHDRMPVILSPTSYASWLDVNSKDAAQLLAPQVTELVLQAVSPLVNNPANDDARCLEPRGEGLLVGENRTLF